MLLIVDCSLQSVVVPSIYRSPSTCEFTALTDLETIFNVLSPMVESVIKPGMRSLHVPGLLKLLWFVHPPQRVLIAWYGVCDWLNKFYGFSLLSVAYVTLAVIK